MAVLVQDRSRAVDEYRSQTLVPDTEMLVTLLPQFEQMQERIESIIVTGPVFPPVPTGQTTTTNGITGIAPGAGTTITSQVLTAGTYTVNWTAELTGAALAGDLNNFGLYLGASLIAQSENLAVVGEYPQPLETVIVPGGGGTLAVKNIGAGTVAAIYGAQLETTLNGSTNIGTPFTLRLGGRTWSLSLPQTGVLVIAPVGILLDRTDERNLTSVFSGDWSLELIGYADARYRSP